MTWSYCFLITFVLICKNNGFWGKREGSYYDWKEVFETYREE